MIALAGLLLLLAATIASRAVLTARRADRVDIWSHLLYVRAIRENGHRIPARTDRFVFGGAFDYPWLIHWMLSFVLPGRLARWQAWVPTLFASATTVTVFLAGRHAAGQYLTAPEAVWVGWLAAALFITGPMATNSWSGLDSVGDRPLGVLLVFVTLYSAIWFEQTGSALALAGAATAGGLVFLSSKFAVQTLVFLTPLLALFTRAPVYLLVLALSLASATLLSAGGCWRILAGHIRHSRFYSTTFQWNHVATTVKHRGVLDLLRSWRHPTRWLRLGLSIPPLRAVVYCPTLLLGAYAAVVRDSLRAYPPMDSLLLLMAAAFVMCLLVAGLRPLRFIGEADRYVYFGAFLPGCVVAAFLAVRPEHALDRPLVALALALSAGLTAAEFLVKKRLAAGREAGSRDGLFAALRQLGPSTVLCVPANFSAEVAYHTPQRPLMWLMNVPSLRFPEFGDLFPQHYPFPNADLRLLREKYGLATVVVYRRFVDPAYQRAHGIDIRYDFSGWRVVFESDAHIVYTPA